MIDDGFIAGEDVCWEHIESECFKHIDWLYIVLTDSNKELVLEGLKKIHVPCEIIDDKVYICGYRYDFDFLK